MRVRNLRIEASKLIADHGVVPPNLHFRWTAHHVRQLFMAFLPRDFTLDGSSVIQITCGPRGDERQYLEGMGSSEYYVEDFDFVAYARATPAVQERILLATVETALCDIANRAGSSDAELHSAACAIEACNFRHCTEVVKLRKSLRSQRRTIRIFRGMAADLGETWHLELQSRDGSVIASQVLGNSPNYLDRRDFYKKVELTDGSYVLRDNLGKVVYEFDWAAL